MRPVHNKIFLFRIIKKLEENKNLLFRRIKTKIYE